MIYWGNDCGFCTQGFSEAAKFPSGEGVCAGRFEGDVELLVGSDGGCKMLGMGFGVLWRVRRLWN